MLALQDFVADHRIAASRARTLLAVAAVALAKLTLDCSPSCKVPGKPSDHRSNSQPVDFALMAEDRQASAQTTNLLPMSLNEMRNSNDGRRGKRLRVRRAFVYFKCELPKAEVGAPTSALGSRKPERRALSARESDQNSIIMPENRPTEISVA